MELKSKITNDMKDAMRAKDSVRLGAIRMLQSEVKKREIDSRKDLTEPEIFKVIQSLVKQRQDAAEAFKQGNRVDLAEKEEQEIQILKVYLPSMMERSEVETIVLAAIQESGAKAPADIGKVMKLALERTGGRADGKLVNEIARQKLSQ